MLQEKISERNHGTLVHRLLSKSFNRNLSKKALYHSMNTSDSILLTTVNFCQAMKPVLKSLGSII